MKSENINFYIIYHVDTAEVLDDGTVRVRTGGSTGEELFSGVEDVPPDSPDYGFWLWLKERHKRRWYEMRPARGLDEQAIKKLREQYAHERAGGSR